MEQLKQKRQKIIKKITKYQNKVFELQNELMSIEQDIVSLDYKEVIDSLTLNDQQLEIVNSKHKNTLVIASPGSGKTHTLISMYIKLIVEDKINSKNIIMITFTKKAGQEMLGRLSSLIPTKLPYFVGSLHSFAYRVLSENMELYHPELQFNNYVILDEKESYDMLKNICNNTENDNIDNFKTKISNIIDQASSIYPFSIDNILIKYDLLNYKTDIIDIINIYNKTKKEQKLLDFNDLMIMLCEFLDSKESNDFKNNMKYIFFDEYQDINPIQNYILNKFNDKSNIIVVGDDAQAIYSFRGSSVKFILDFPEQYKQSKLYLLEKNYRSTPEIVNLFQDVISKNTEQYKKDVIAVSENNGIKPIIIGFGNEQKKNEWLINDIFKNKNNGVPLSEMVILARNNESLSKIEIELVKSGITVIKHTGLSILDKPHVKDFMAFITILLNDKSSIHWKRILALHQNISINTANEIIINNQNVREAILKLKDTKVMYSNDLKELNNILSVIKDDIQDNHMKDVDKAHFILSYLEKIWSQKNDSHIKDKISDILLLINYLSQTDLKNFINELYLNQSIETNLDNTLYLTTIHGSKGLEWNYVYLIDVDSDKFPNSRKNNYLTEGLDMEEERRLFYVACSRAKNNLIITFTYNNDPKNVVSMSPFIREIDQNLYTGINMNYKTYKMTGNIKTDINNYIKYHGTSKIYPIIKSLNFEINNIHNIYTLPKHLDKFKNTKIITNNFMEYLLIKILQINFSKDIKSFNMNINKFDNIPDKIKQNYKDELYDWRNLLNDIFYISCNNLEDKDNIFNQIKDMLINNEIYNFYDIISKSFSQYIKKQKPKVILSNYNISLGNVKTDIDIYMDNTLINFKINEKDILSSFNITESLLQAYLLFKKGKTIENIIIYNPFNGQIVKYNISSIDLQNVANCIYGHFTK